MANAEKTLVTVATYNEMENLPELVKQVFETVPEVDLLVIDDNSPDGTGRWCDEKAADEPRLNCLHRAGKLGLGTATIAGMKYAIEHGYRFVLNMDADFSHHPRYLPDFLAGMDPPGDPPVDVLIGSRYVPGGGIEGSEAPGLDDSTGEVHRGDSARARQPQRAGSDGRHLYGSAQVRGRRVVVSARFRPGQ